MVDGGLRGSGIDVNQNSTAGRLFTAVRCSAPGAAASLSSLLRGGGGFRGEVWM